MHTSMLNAPPCRYCTDRVFRSGRSKLLQLDRRTCTVGSSKQHNTVLAAMGTPVLYTYPLAYNPFKAALVSRNRVTTCF